MPLKGARGALVLLLTINLFNYIDRYILAAVEPEIRKQFFPQAASSAGSAREELAKAMFSTGWLATAFLVSYVIYHMHAGSVPYTGTGLRRPVYFFILITHIILAAAIVPLALITLGRALRGRFAAHARLARWTLPIWLYVSVTGVVVYWMLYRL